MRGRNTMLVGGAALGAIILISGCSITSHGRLTRIPIADVERIQASVTTKQEILLRLGEPQQIVHRPSGVETFIYSHGVERSIGIPWLLSLGRTGGNSQTLVITFQNGVVSDYEYTTDRRHLSR